MVRKKVFKQKFKSRSHFYDGEPKASTLTIHSAPNADPTFCVPFPFFNSLPAIPLYYTGKLL